MSTTGRQALIRLGIVAALLLAVGLACSLSKGGGGGEAEAQPSLAASITPPSTRTPIPTFTAFPTATPWQGGVGVATATRIALYPTPVYYTPFPVWTPVQATPYPYLVRISYPQSGSVLAGYITVVGSASHPRFLQYAVEYGPDPNPANLWYPIMLGQRQPVINGALGAWNTGTVQDGRYQLRLHVWLNDGTETFDVVTGLQVSNRAPTAVPTLTPTPKPNQAPVIQPIASRVIRVGDEARVDVQVTDPDNDPVNLFVASSNDAIARAQVTGTRQITVTGASAGTAQITVTAADSRSAITSTAFLVTVEGQNQAPSISPILGQQLEVGQTLDVPISVSDPDRDALTVSAASNDERILTASAPNTGAVRLVGVGVGTANVTVTVDDKRGGVIRTTFQAVVGAPNLPPTIEGIPAQTLRAGDALTVNYVAVDPDGDRLSATVASDTPDIVRAEVMGPGVLRLTAGRPGQATVTLAVTDGVNNAALATFTVTVVAGNAPPALQPVAPQTMSSDEVRDLPFAASDPENDPLTAQASSDNPDVVAASVIAPGLLRLDANRAGTATITLSVDDRRNAPVSTTFTVSVAQVNLPPRIESIFPQTLSAGSTLDVPYAASDPEGDALQANVASDDPNIVRAAITAPGVIHLEGAGAGTTTVTLSVSDATNPAVAQPFTVTVAQNAPPVVQPLGPVALTAGETAQVAYVAGDPEGGAVNTAATSDNPGVVQAQVTAPGTITLMAAAPGTATVTLAVDDGANAPVTAAFTVTVAAANQPPSIQPIGPVALAAGESENVPYVVSDPDGDTLVAVAASDNPGVVSANVTAPGVITLNAVGAGSATVTLSINDGVNPPVSMPFAVTVARANQPPTVSALGPLNLTPGQTVEVPFQASDPDGDPLTADAASDNPGVATASISNGVIAVTANGVGGATITLSVSDGINPAVTTSFPVFVELVNELPQISPVEPQALDVGASITVPVYATDPDGGGVSLAAQSDNPGVANAGTNNSGEVVVTGVAAGSANVTVTATDEEGSSASVTFSVTVRGLNNAPVIQPIGDQNLTVGEQIVVPVAISDPDGNPVVVSAVSQNPGVVEAAALDVTQIALRAVGPGSTTVEVTADDAQGGVTQAAFVVNVAGASSNIGFDVMAYPVIPDVSGGMAQALNQLFRSGVANFANRPGAFSKVGDGAMNNANFLTPFGSGDQRLGAHGDLQAVIDFYRNTGVREADPSVNSFNVNSEAAREGFGADDLMLPPNGPPCTNIGAPSFLACEYMLTRPSVALISFSADNVTYLPVEQFRGALQQLVVETMSSYGVIPVLATIPADPGHSAAELAPYNAAIVEIAQQTMSTGIPLWNLARAMQERGVADPSSVAPEGPAVLEDSALSYGVNVRNLTALQTLQAVRNGVGIN